MKNVYSDEKMLQNDLPLVPQLIQEILQNNSELLKEQMFSFSMAVLHDEWHEDIKHFKPDTSNFIPMNEDGKSYKYMDFTFFKDLHWKDEILDTQLRDGSNFHSIFVLSATACGKTSAIIRSLCNQYGLFFCCSFFSSAGNDNTIDFLMLSFWKECKNLSQDQLIAFGISLASLVFIARIIFLITFLKQFKKEKQRLPTPSEFARIQFNGATSTSAEIFSILVNEKYHHCQDDKLENIVYSLTNMLKLELDLNIMDAIPIFIDEIQLFCPNKHNILEKKFTCSYYNQCRKNDLFSPLYSAITGGMGIWRLIVSGTSYSSPCIEQWFSGVNKGCRECKIVVGHEMIETEADVLDKISLFMKVSDTLKEFINSHIHQYLPIRRRIFTSACNNILKNKEDTIDSYKKSFDKSFATAVSSFFRKYAKNFATKNIFQILKFITVFNPEFLNEKEYRGKFLFSEDIISLKDSLIATGVAVYYIEGYFQTETTNLIEKVYFNFDEPLFKQFINYFTKELNLTLNLQCFKTIFKNLFINQRDNAKFDGTFSVILAYLSSQKKLLKEFEFLKYSSEEFKQSNEIFFSSICEFNIKGIVSAKSLYNFIAKQKYYLESKLREIIDDILEENKSNSNDSLYWCIFNNTELRHLLVGICYFPSVNAHQDTWILVTLTTNPITYGFISFGFKLLKDDTKENFLKYKSKNLENTYLSCMEFSYYKSTKFLYKNFNSTTEQSYNDSANSIPNLPISITIHKEYGTKDIIEIPNNIAIQIGLSEMNQIFPGFETVFNKYF